MEGASENWRSFSSFVGTYSDKAAFLRDIPRLIIEHNIHGIDIDPRAVQIAGLSLWLRAQRAWHSQGIAAGDRPQVTRSNIVCAEPMPGDQQQLAAFCKELHPAIAQMVTAIFEEMRLAGEAGSLLKIEQEIKTLVAAARQQFIDNPPDKKTQMQLFGGAKMPEEQQLEFDLSGITDQQFFEQAEETIYEALRKYASETSEGGFRRKLFAGDAEKGFAFIEQLRKAFDVALMNPPFGSVAKNFKKEFERNYPNAKTDIYPAFIERGIQQLRPKGMLGAITSRTGFFLSSFQDWREQSLLKQSTPVVFADLGPAVMDSAMVESAAYCISKQPDQPSTFFRVLVEREKEKALRQRVKELDLSSRSVFLPKSSDFAAIPGSPFAYWVTSTVRSLFRDLPKFETDERFAYSGTSTGNDMRFVRLWWEVESIGGRWRSYTKGGRRSPYYSELPCVVDWKQEGIPIEISYAGGRVRKVHFGREGMTWPLRGACFSASAVPKGCIFGTAGKVALAKTNDLPYLLAVLNSRLFDSLVTLFAGKVGGVQYEVGLIQNIPLPNVSKEARSSLTNAVQTIWAAKRSVASASEVSHAFQLPALLQVEGDTLQARHASWIEHLNTVETVCEGTQRQINETCFREYQISENERDVVSEGLSGQGQGSDESQNGVFELVDVSEHDLASLLVMWSFGTAIGRFELRPSRVSLDCENSPFETLPSRSPGMLNKGEVKLGTHGAIDDGILVDDIGHERDVAAAVDNVLEVVVGTQVSELISILGGSQTRDWLREKLFAFHFEEYSEASRNAPIYWPISTESGSYTLWFYYHRLTDQTLYKAVNDFVEPKLKETARQLSDLRAINDRSSPQEKELAKLTELESELEQFKADLLEIAAFWKPNLNDGVQITAAPFHKFFRLKKWRDKLAKTWKDLESGKYDWAHTWPSPSGPTASCAKNAPPTAASPSPTTSKSHSGTKSKSQASAAAAVRPPRWSGNPKT